MKDILERVEGKLGARQYRAAELKLTTVRLSAEHEYLLFSTQPLPLRFLTLAQPSPARSSSSGIAKVGGNAHSESGEGGEESIELHGY